jgi:hypothetical protein
MKLPPGRGPVSEHVRTALAADPERSAFQDVVLCDDLEPQILDEDLQLALWMLYEQSYRGFDDACDHEWDPAAVAVRVRLEKAFEARLRRGTGDAVRSVGHAGGDLVAQFERLLETVDVPSVASYLQRNATREQVLDFLAVRSLYHLKESDPHAFVVGRVDGAAKVALAELQYDEFGAGRPDQLHAQLYRDALVAAGLDPDYGAYLDRASGLTLAVNNVMSMFALQHRLRAAALGHLAAFESTSSVPCRRVASGVERVGLSATTAHYFHEHVEADSAHEQVAVRDICGNYVAQHPDELGEVLFGAAACLHLDGLAAREQLAAWDAQTEKRLVS